MRQIEGHLSPLIYMVKAYVAIIDGFETWLHPYMGEAEYPHSSQNRSKKKKKGVIHLYFRLVKFSNIILLIGENFL